MAEAVTLAHVARATVLATMLDPAEFSVVLASDPRFDFLFPRHDVQRVPISSIDGASFDRALERGKPIYDVATLERYVADDLRVIGAVEPDVVVGDFRLSLGISARLAGIPYVNVTNAGWSPYAAPKFLVPDIPLTRVLGVRTAQWLFDRLRPTIFALHAAPLNRVRVRNGLPALRGDLRESYTDADRILYADLREVIDTPGAPESHRYLGPLLWAPDLPDPDWVDDVPRERPIVYVNLGSSGSAASLDAILSALSTLPITVVTATGGRAEPPSPHPNRFSARFLDGHRWSARARVVVSNGGSPTCYQALANGVPVVGVPGNLDQFLNMAAVEATGAGVLIRSGRSLADRVRAVVRQEAFDAGPCLGPAQWLGKCIAATDPASVLASTLRVATGRSEPAR